MAAPSTFPLGTRQVETTRDRLRLRDAAGRILGSWPTSGKIRLELCMARAGMVVLPTHGLRLYVFIESEDRPASIGLRQVPQGIWLRRGRILVAGRDRFSLYSAGPLAEMLRVRTQGRIDTKGVVLAYPVGVLAAPREAHVVNLSSGGTFRVDAGSAIGRMAVHRSIAVIVERDRIRLVDGRSLLAVAKLDVRQRLRPETLRTGLGLAAVATRDTVVIADLETAGVVQVQVSGRVLSLRMKGRIVSVVTRNGTLRLGPDGRAPVD